MCQCKCVSRYPHVEGRSNVNKRNIKQMNMLCPVHQMAG